MIDQILSEKEIVAGSQDEANEESASSMPPNPPLTSKFGRCTYCQRNKDKKTRNRCFGCDNYICSDHSKRLYFCSKCEEKISL